MNPSNFKKPFVCALRFALSKSRMRGTLYSGSMSVASHESSGCRRHAFSKPAATKLCWATLLGS